MNASIHKYIFKILFGGYATPRKYDNYSKNYIASFSIFLYNSKKIIINREVFMIQSFLMTFSMYSKIPVPQVEYKEKNMRYTVAFLPFVGLAIAAVTWLWLYFAPVFHFSRLFVSIIALIIPILVTGGIHFNDFINISKHGTIALAIYLLCNLAIWDELYPFYAKGSVNDMTILCFIMLTYVISRCFAGLAILSFPKIKDSSFDTIFTDSSELKPAKIIILIILGICMIFEFFLQPVLSGTILCCGMLFFFYYRLKCMKKFGGISAKVAGWFLQLCELFLLFVLAISCKYYY